jgi:hypothetical protein
MQTTLYNHVTLGTECKPLIPNLVYKNCIESLNSGDTYYYLDVLTKYSLEPYQQQFLKSKYEDLCQQKL